MHALLLDYVARIRAGGHRSRAWRLRLQADNSYIITTAAAAAAANSSLSLLYTDLSASVYNILLSRKLQLVRVDLYTAGIPVIPTVITLATIQPTVYVTLLVKYGF